RGLARRGFLVEADRCAGIAWRTAARLSALGDRDILAGFAVAGACAGACLASPHVAGRTFSAGLAGAGLDRPRVAPDQIAALRAAALSGTGIAGGSRPRRGRPLRRAPLAALHRYRREGAVGGRDARPGGWAGADAAPPWRRIAHSRDDGHC